MSLTAQESKSVAQEIAEECQRDEDMKFFAAIESLIQARIEEMKARGYVHVWDEFGVE